MSLAAKEYTPEELDALEAQAKQRPVYDQIAGGVGAAMAYYDGPQESKAEYTPEELDARDALYAQPEMTPEELDQRLVNAKYDANTLLPPEQLKEADAVEKRLRDQGKQPGVMDTAFALGGGILQSVADWNMALDKSGNVKAAVKNALIKTGAISGDYERMPMLEAALQAPASAKAGIQGATLNAMETAIALNGLAKGKPRYRVKETGEFVFSPLGGVAPLTQLAGEGKTLVPVTDADLEEHRYQQYATENAVRKTYLDLTGEEVFGQAPNQSFTLPVEIAADPWNFIAFGAANKVTGASRMGKLFSSKTLGAAEAVAGGSANMIDKGADVFTRAVQKMSFGMLKRDTQRAIAKSAAYGGGAAAIGTLLTNAPSEARNTALTLMSLYPMYKMGSGVLRRVQGAAGTGKLIMREAADATNGLDDVARAAVASNPKVPQQIREALTNPSKFTPIESTPARIAKSEAFSPRVREVAARLANPLVVQASRAAGATARGAALGTALNIPFAEAYREMGDGRTADSVYAGGLLFGAAGGAASRVTGARARRRDAAASDIGRMLVDIQKTNAGEDIGAPGVSRAFETYYSMAEPGRMLTDVELAGGDIDSLLRNTKFEDLAGMAAMQGFYRDTVDFVPLNAFDYEANVKALGGTGTAGYFLHAPEGQRARLFLNTDARRTDVAPHEYGHALLQSAATSPEMKNSARAFINQRYGPERLDAMAREYAGQLIKNRNAKAYPDQKLDVGQAEIDSMIYELGEAGLGRGDGDRLDWLRDEIFAEEHRAAGIDYAQIRRNIPDGFSVVGFAENVLGANARALGVAGVPIDPQTGALRTPPDRLFKDNPLLAADSVMRRNVQQYVRAYKQWLNDPAHEVPTGAPVSRTGNPNELRNNPNVTFRDYGNGRLENELAFIDESGNVKVKDKKNDPERAKFIRARQQQVREMIDRGTKEPNDPTFGARVRNGQRIVAGKKLPPRFDMTRFPAPLKDLARRTEALAEAGETMQVRYFALGKSKDVFKQGDIRGVQAINREVMFVEWQATKDGNINAFVVDLTQFRNRAMKAIADRDPSLSEINWDFKQLEADLRRVLDNHANGRAGADGIGDKRRNAVNALLGIGTKTNRIANPLTGLGGKGSALKTLRLDAFDEVAGTGRQGFEFDYQKANGNFMPDKPAPRPNMDSDLELPNRMPSALPQAGMAMPDAPANLSTDQILRELEENQGYLGLSTLGMREGRPVKGGAQQTRELLKRNTALNEELRRRGGPQEESDVARVLRQRGQAMPDVDVQWETYAESLRDDVESWSPARDTGKIDYEMQDVVDSFVDFARTNPQMTGGELTAAFYRAEKPTASQRKKLNAAIANVGEPPKVATGGTRGQAMPDGSQPMRGQAMADVGSAADDPPRRLIDMPQSALKVLHANSTELPKPAKKLTNATVALTLADVAERHNNGIITSSNITPEQKSDLMILGADEAEAALKASGKNAGNWYSVAIEAALGIAGVIYRELSDVVAARSHAVLAKEADPVKAGQFALRLPLAITSQNMTVKLNTRASNEQFNIFLKTGKFDPSIAYGEKAKSISGNLDLANTMIDELGSLLALEDFVSRQFTVRELEIEASKIAGRSIKIAGRKDDIVNGAAIFGPKIGQGFLQNLMGKFDPVTIDLWMRRTWGRWTGDVVGDGVTAQRLARLVDQSRKSGRKLPDSIKRLRTTMRSMGETKTGKAKKPELTMSEDVEARLETDTAFRKEVEAFAKEVNAEFQGLYKLMSDVMSPALAKKVQDAIERADRLPDQADAILSDVYNAVVREQSRVKQQLDKKWSGLSLDEKREMAARRLPGWADVKPQDRAKFIKKSKLILKGDWLEMQHQAEGRTAKLGNPQKNLIKPAWANAAKSIVSELNPIDIPSDMDRRVITEVVNGIREELERRGHTVTNADVQAILWYPEKDLWAKLRGEEESILKQSYDDEFINIAEGLGLGLEARKVAKQIRGY